MNAKQVNKSEINPELGKTHPNSLDGDWRQGGNLGVDSSLIIAQNLHLVVRYITIC